MKTIRILIYIAVALVIVIAGCVVAYNVIGNNLKVFAQAKIQNVELSKISDGEYIGQFSILPIKVITKTTILDHKIIDIEIIEHRTGQGQPAEAIIKNILSEQRINVDVIAGATYSSKAIEKSIENGLTKN